MTDPRLFDTGDQAVDAALTDLAVADPVSANQAEAGFSELTWGQGASAGPPSSRRYCRC